MRTARRIVFRILDPETRGTAFERSGNIFLVLLILANVAAMVVGSVASIYAEYGLQLERFEAISIVIFTVEYVLRVWTCVERPEYSRPVLGRLRFMVTPMALIDLLAILPAYIPGQLAYDLRFVRIARVARMLRVLKIARYSSTLQTVGIVFREKRVDIALVLVFLSLLVVVSSSIMYIVEHPAQPKAFSSIPAAMWWSVMTLTTVGYGDIYPITPLGKVLAGIIALIGIGFFALPAGILAAAFAEDLAQRKAPKACPHCGKELA